PEAADRLRLANKAELLRIAARDLGHPEPAAIVHEVAEDLADLADVVMASALAIARAQVPGHERVRLAVLGMGKCGARELNYLSDIDVVYVAEPADGVPVDEALQVATRLVAASARVCSGHSAAGTIWQVDTALRPDGNAGPLVRTLASHRAYYQKWAKNWEFQAMLKARPMAGDLELGQQFVDMVAPMVWQAGGQPNFMSEIQAMRQRVISLIPARDRDREIKLGAGGLRDVEFTVQLLQLVHGRIDERLRLRGTLESLAALVEHGYIGRVDGRKLDEAYRFLRVLEHREQLFRLRRTHLMPDNPAELGRLARQVDAEDGPALWQQWRSVTRNVQRLQQRVFYSPLLETVSRLSGDELRLSPEAAADRLRALGFNDPTAALRHIEALTTGLNRTAEIQRQLMPAMLRWFSEGPNPDLGLLSFRRLSDEMGTTSWYMRALRDEGWLAERLARLLSASRYIGELLRRDPSVIQLLGADEIASPRTRDDLTDALGKVIERHSDDTDQAVTAVRGVRRRELFRLAAGDVLDTIDLESLGRGHSDLTGATVQAALDLAVAELGAELPLGVVAMGRWGGQEMGYASDADAIFLVPDDAGPDQLAWADKVVARVRSMLGGPGPEPPLEVDADLRPDGRNGPMVRTLGSYLAYYRKWSSTWESQALLRAGYGAGDRGLVAELLGQLDFRRYPADGITPAQVVEIRRLKGRMEHERATRASFGQNLKLGPGGLSDVEWTVQLLQLQHAGRLPELRVQSTLDALRALRVADLVDAADAAALERAWRLASELRNKTMLVRGRASDQLPSDPRETASVAMLLGYQHGQASQLMEDWAKAARHAAQVVGRLFWGEHR
ncbi:MAG: bifunctional [glutamine synthetase] adenylyltransferase/[glutamine synthetase]-adenylyl-L-tyrosine phosphorylase, partial [Brooklawnia sp.]|uniref:bifunctional [glutamine synthetase] adenylyltransferase/[glutamine synthetase]-adenylyl-L-tyrosine phosphorylase n=1 Tax=Brooklawnia sp. TaxID=2699740 RepID=UPI003C766337